MAARARLIPAPGRACWRSARFGGAIRESTGRRSSDCRIMLRFLNAIARSSSLRTEQAHCHGNSVRMSA